MGGRSRLARIDAPRDEDHMRSGEKGGNHSARRARGAVAAGEGDHLHEVERGKYFRLVAEVVADGENMSDLLLERVLAWPYDGEKRARNSCEGMRGGCEWCYWFSFAFVLGY